MEGTDGFVLAMGAGAESADLAALLRFARAIAPAPRGSREIQLSGRDWRLAAIGDRLDRPELERTPGTVTLCSHPARLRVDDAATPIPGWRIDLHEGSDPQLQAIGDATASTGLHWAEWHGQIWISDRPDWLLAIPGLPFDEDPLYFAAYYAGLPTPWSRSPLARIRGLPAGHALHWRRGGAHLRSSPPMPEPDLGRLGRDALGQRFRQLLTDAVAAVSDRTASVGLLLSGGFDSAAVLASLRAVVGAEARLTCVTAGFRRRGGIDEREAAAPTARRFGVDHRCVDSAAYPPNLLGDGELRGPSGNPFRALSDAVYATLSAAGVKLCLTGQFADELDAGPLDFWREWRQCSPGAILPIRSILGQVESAMTVLRHRFSMRQAQGWTLHDELRGLLNQELAQERAHFRPWPRPAQAAWALGRDTAASVSAEFHHFRRHGLIPYHPYRHWPLMRFLLSLPAVETRVLRSQKRLQKYAMSKVIPEAARRPFKIGSQASLFMASFQSSHAAMSTELQSARPWEAYLHTAPADDLSTEESAFALWRAYAHQRWRTALAEQRRRLSRNRIGER